MKVLFHLGRLQYQRHAVDVVITQSQVPAWRSSYGYQKEASFTRTVYVTSFMSGSFDHFNKQYDG